MLSRKNWRQREKGAGTFLGHWPGISLLGDVLHHLLSLVFSPSVLFLNFVQLTSFLASALSVLLSIPAASEQGAVWELSCWLG